MPFHQAAEEGATSVKYAIKDLLARGEILEALA
jgi:hypothetical protein